MHERAFSSKVHVSLDITKLDLFNQPIIMRHICRLTLLVILAAFVASDVDDICLQIAKEHSKDTASLLHLCPAEFETIRDAYGARQNPSAAAARHPSPWSNTFYSSVPANLTAANLTTAPTPPVFGVIGDAMAALGFHLCDIEHYLDHTNGSNALPLCPDRAGWAAKVAGAYDDKVWLFHHMIRASNNAQRVTVPLVYNQFDNDTTQLKLVVVAIGSKYSKVDGFAEPLANMTQSMLSRGIKVVLMTRPPINTAPQAPLWFDNYNTTTAMAVNAIIRSVAVQTGAACLDTWEFFIATGDSWKDALGPDGIHYSPMGQQLVYEGLMRLIETQYPQLSPSRIFAGK